MKAILTLLLGLSVSTLIEANTEAADPVQISIGERLFLETRFAQAYYANPDKADPVMEKTITTRKPFSGTFAGKSMNCRACHMVDEFAEHDDGGMRSYADYARRSPIPDRKDNAFLTGRNSMSLVNISVPLKEGVLFHFDGEFNTMEDLVLATLTGRNYGWKPHEAQVAIKHIADIIRKDNGKGDLASEFGGSYNKVLTGSDKTIAKKFRLPTEFRVNVKKANDQQIVAAVVRLITAYVLDLNFARDAKGHYIGSPYDLFLKINKLPRKPAANETFEVYGQRLLNAVNKLKAPKFVGEKDGEFETHKQKFVFGKKELRGMKLFFTQGSENKTGGSCIRCHNAPHFSDYKFHNTGLTQHNYDKTHGAGAFSKLDIPGLHMRKLEHDAYLPATVAHPDASSRFRSAISKEKPGYVDLGMWNIYANPDMPAPQQKLHVMLCDQGASSGYEQCKTDSLLKLAIASFKTPVLRDLGHSAPYMHTGQFDDLSKAISFYIGSSGLGRSNKLRNGDKALAGIFIRPEHVEPLAAFIKSLNEDYD